MFAIFGFNEKAYNKNTEIFKQRLNDIYTNLATRGINSYEIGNAITSVISVLDWHGFPKGKDTRTQKMVDDYISES